METIITHSENETKILAGEVIRSLKNTNIITLSGDLGSGKTTFSQGIGHALGITTKILSPTFIILRSYDIENEVASFKRLYHIDLYRIQDPKEVIDIGILDFMNDRQNLVVIEWPEKMGEYLPEKRIGLRFEYIDNEKRKISIEERTF